jgi:hypothetical protein
VDLATLLSEKKKKANENNKSFQKATKVNSNNTKRQIPMRKGGRGK